MSHAKAMQAQLRALKALDAAQAQARQKASLEAAAERGLADGRVDPGPQPVQASEVQPGDVATLGMGGSAALKPMQAAAEAGEALLPQAVSRIPGSASYAADVATRPRQWANFYRDWGAAQDGGKPAGEYLAKEAVEAGGSAWDRVKKGFQAFQDYTPEIVQEEKAYLEAGSRKAARDAAERARLGAEAAKKAAQLESVGEQKLAAAGDKTR